MRKFKCVIAGLLVFATLFSVGCGSSGVPSNFDGDYQEKTLAEVQTLSASLTDVSLVELFKKGIKISGQSKTTVEMSDGTGSAKKEWTTDFAILSRIDEAGKFEMSEIEKFNAKADSPTGGRVTYNEFGEAYYVDGVLYTHIAGNAIDEKKTKQPMTIEEHTSEHEIELSSLVHGVFLTDVFQLFLVNDNESNMTILDAYSGVETTEAGTKIKLVRNYKIDNVSEAYPNKSTYKNEYYYIYDANNLLSSMCVKTTYEIERTTAGYTEKEKGESLTYIVPNDSPITLPSDLSSYVLV